MMHAAAGGDRVCVLVAGSVCWFQESTWYVPCIFSGEVNASEEHNEKKPARFHIDGVDGGCGDSRYSGHGRYPAIPESRRAHAGNAGHVGNKFLAYDRGSVPAGWEKDGRYRQRAVRSWLGEQQSDRAG